MRKTIVIFLGLIVASLLVLSLTVTVPETEFVIVSRFGDPRRVIDEAGLHVRWPPPVDTVTRIDRRIHVLDPDSAEYLTSDKKNILVSAFMVWSVSEPVEYLVAVNDQRGAEARLSDVMRSEVGTILGSHPLSDLVFDEGESTGMAGIENEITAKAKEKAERFGIEVRSVRLKRLNFPTGNKEAVFRRMEAERERIARQYRSEGEEEAAKIRAKADLAKAVLLNEAAKNAEKRRGAADAEATRIYAEAYGRDPDFYRFLRSLEAYRRIIKEDSTVVVPHDSPLLEVLGSKAGDLKAPERR
jgi:membrane protease subunit HflC